MIAALLLAAGSARRFGSQKLLEDLAGKPVIRRAAEALAGAPVDEIVVVVPREHEGIRRALSGIDVRFVVNPDSESGMGGSLARGAAALGADTEAVLVALADEPYPSRVALERVVERHRAGGVSIVAPTFGGVRGHPVLFARAVFDELRALTGDRGARAVADRDPGRVAAIEIGVARPADVDTPADLARLRAVPLPGGAPAAATLLESFMPQFDVRAEYGTDVRAPAEVVYRAALETNLADSFLTRALMTLRMLGRREGYRAFRIGDLPSRGAFFELGRNPSEIVAGIVGTFWKLRGNVMHGDKELFRAPPPGAAKAAWNVLVEPRPFGARLTTETRVLCADAESRRQFRRYWALVGPFSGLIRIDALRLIRERAQYLSA